MRHNDPTQKSHKPQSNCCSAGSASSALNVVVALLTLTATLWLAPVAVVRSVRLQADQLTVRPFESLRAALSYVEGRLKPDTRYGTYARPDEAAMKMDQKLTVAFRRSRERNFPSCALPGSNRSLLNTYHVALNIMFGDAT
jgi:hypothetical protein